jgi:hypothetical protein
VEHTDNNGDTSVILVQSHGWPTDWFGLVTGFLEEREDPAKGVLREVKEGSYEIVMGCVVGCAHAILIHIHCYDMI